MIKFCIPTLCRPQVWLSTSSDLHCDALRDLRALGAHINVINNCQALDKETRVVGLAKEMREGVLFMWACLLLCYFLFPFCIVCFPLQCVTKLVWMFCCSCACPVHPALPGTGQGPSRPHQRWARSEQLWAEQAACTTQDDGVAAVPWLTDSSRSALVSESASWACMSARVDPGLPWMPLQSVRLSCFCCAPCQEPVCPAGPTPPWSRT